MLKKKACNEILKPGLFPPQNLDIFSCGKEDQELTIV